MFFNVSEQLSNKLKYLKTIKKNIFPLVIVFVITVFISATGYGQNRQVPQNLTPSGSSPGTPAGSYALSGFESVNPFSGKVNFSLPLLKVGGRGDAAYTLSLSIQRNWSITHNIDDPNLYGFPATERYVIRHNYTPTDQDTNLSYGFTSNLSVGFMKGRRVGENISYRLCGHQPCYDQVLTRLSFIQPDGSEIEFRDVAKGGRITAPYDSNLSRGTHWVSSDGSNATFISNEIIYDLRDKGGFQGTFFPSGTVYLANGTKYTIENGRVTQIIDINGNKVTPGRDSIGREIIVTANDNPLPNVHSNRVLNFKGTNNAARTIKVNYSFLENRLSTGYTLSDLWDLFPTVPAPVIGRYDYNPQVISSVVLPDGRSYEFRYNSYGELTEILLPTGGRIEYVWQESPGVYGIFEDAEVMPHMSAPPPDDGANPEIHRRVQKRRVFVSGELESETIYGTPVTDTESNTWITIENYAKQAGNLLLQNKSRHRYIGMPIPLFAGQIRPPLDTDLFEGKEIETEIYNNANVLLSKTKTEYEPGTPLTANPTGGINLRVKQITETLADLNLSSKKTFSYDNLNNQTDVLEYDYGIGASGSFKRRTHTDYLSDPNYTSHTGAHLRGLPTETWVSSDADGINKVSRTEFKYDETLLMPRSNVIGWTDPQRTARGNVTKTGSWLKYGNEPETWLESRAEYDVLGNVVKTIDAQNNVTQIDYTDRFGSPDGEARLNSAPSQLNGQSTFAFPTSATNALGWVTGYSQVDYFTGQSVDAEDINGVVGSTFYNDLLDRPTQSVAANNLPAFKRQTNIIYDDANRRVETKADLNAFNDNALKSESFYDGLGRTIESRKYESDGGYVASKSIPFLMMQDPETLIWRAGTKASNPYRPGAGEQPVWTTALSDSLGRSIKTITPDGAMVKTEYSGNTVTVTDQAGKKRRSISNALGQLTRIDEPDNSGNLGTIDNPVQPTVYKYNTLGKMIEVTQGNQKRYFLYDSLSRLLRVRQPEQQANPVLNLPGGETTNTQWSVGLSYDNNGNVLTATDAKNVTITNNYDALNRAQTRDYSDSLTPTVNYTYDDPNIAYSKGRLTKISSSISEMRYTSFDQTGRLLTSEQATDGKVYPSSYQYNLSGVMTEQMYPSGRIVKNFLENDGDLAAIVSKTANAPFKNYASNFAYTATGVIKHLQIGNGLWESAKLNSREQVTELNLGTSATDGSLWKLNYAYGELDASGNIDATKNSGNIAKQTISAAGLANPFVQIYKYDALDRIKEAEEKNNGIQMWKQTWDYDRYGNRTAFAQTVHGQQLPINSQTLPQIDTNTNRFQTGQGYNYDADGNLIQDSNGRQFIFNGDNKQTEVKDASNNPVGRYYYDGNGKRVKKVTNTETVVFVYDGTGKLVAEYSTAAPVSNPTTNYTATDPLGSPRVITNKQGQIVSRRDFMPFGEEVISDATYRTANLKYGSNDNIRQKFTGYQRDEETGLDFAEARYYNNNHGRFTAVDPLLASGKSANPQTFNRYAYTMNRPLILTDPTGLQAGTFSEFKFSVYVRAFAPFEWFGPNQMARGDNRGFSTDPSASYRIQAYSEATAADDGSYYTMSRTEASPPSLSETSIGLTSWTAYSECYINDQNGNYQEGPLQGENNSLGYHAFGNDDAIPFVSGNIDLHPNFKFSYANHGNGVVDMSVTGTVTGDQFPAAEALMTDTNRNSVMLGVFAPSASSGPVGSLPGDGALPMIDVNVTVRVNNGVFQGVVENGNVVPLEEYNRRFTDQPAVRPNQ